MCVCKFTHWPILYSFFHIKQHTECLNFNLGYIDPLFVGMYFLYRNKVNIKHLLKF